jgi:hypothetical protein
MYGYSQYLGDLGGLWCSMKLAFNIFAGLVSSMSFSRSLISNLFQVKSSSRESKVKEIAGYEKLKN